jgi:hypothetical protein
MLERRPDSLPKAAHSSVPAVARATVSPPALVLAAAGIGLSLVGGLPVAAAIGIGLLGWALGFGSSAARAARRQRRGRRPERIDPYAVPDPWRRFVRESLNAQTKFAQAVGRASPGPLQDRLHEIEQRVDDAVHECWRVAHLGAALDAALAGLDRDHTSQELRQVQEQRHQLVASGSSDRADALDQTEAALASRLQSTLKVEAAVQRTTDRLRLLTAELNEAVASAVELSLDASDPAAASPLAGKVDDMVGEIESLRQGLEEAESLRAPRAGPSS